MSKRRVTCMSLAVLLIAIGVGVAGDGDGITDPNRLAAGAPVICLSGLDGPVGDEDDTVGYPGDNSIRAASAMEANRESSKGSTKDPVIDVIPAEGQAIRGKLARMTLEEKVGQMILAGVEGTELDAEAREMISQHRVGGIILYSSNIQDVEGLVGLMNSVKKANIGGPAPLFISVDQEGGRVSRLPKEFEEIPSNGEVGESGSAKLAGDMGRLIARELKAVGINMDFAPVLDIHSNPDNPIIGLRSFGTTAGLVARLGIAEMKGLRSGGVIPVVKHYPGHGDTSVDSHLELPVVDKSRSQLKKLEWKPFEAAVKERAEAIMVAHILYPKLDPKHPASLSEAIVGKELRGRLGYEGVVITDDLGMGAIRKNVKLAAAAIRAVQAGSDILLVAHRYEDARLVFDTLLENVRSGRLTEARIDESVYRILALKGKYRLSDHPVPVPDLTKLNKDILAWKKRL